MTLVYYQCFRRDAKSDGGRERGKAGSSGWREINRKGVREGGREAYRQTGRYKDKHTDIYIYIYTYIGTYIDTYIHAGKQSHM